MSNALNAVYQSYAAGMNSASFPSSSLRKDELALIVNGTVRNGFVETRPAWAGLPLAFIDSDSQLAFENGVYQGMGFFMSDIGKFYVVAVDGVLYAVDSISLYVIRITDQVFSKFSRHVWFQQRNRWMIAQDGESAPVIIDGFQVTRGADSGGVPTGTFMADGWHRLAVVSPDRRRIYFSDHELDPLTTPISFTEGSLYFGNAQYFEGPPALGKIMGMSFSPYQDTSTGIGPLLVFFEKGVRAYNIAVPRTQWTSQDISQTVLPHVGSSSMFAYANRGSEVVFRDHDGRIRTLRNAQQVEDSGATHPSDFPIWNTYADEDEVLREFSCAATFDSRTLVTTHPMRRYISDGRFNVIHRGIAVSENSNIAADRTDVWAFWTGANICGMTTGPVRGRDTLVAFCADPDGVNRLYMLDRRKRKDSYYSNMGLQEKRIEMILSTGQIDFEQPVLNKRLTGAGVRIGNISSDLIITGMWNRQGHLTEAWFSHKEKFKECIQFSDNGIFEPSRGSNPSLKFPSPPNGADQFFKANMIFKIKGACSFEEMAYEAEGAPITRTNNISCEGLPASPPKSSCDVNVLEYDIVKSNP